VRHVTTLFGDSADILGHRRFQLVLLANLPAYLGTALLSPILESLTDPFGVSVAAIGLMVTAFTAPAIVMIPLSGALTDRLGRRPVLLTGLICFGTGGTLIAFTTDFRLVLALRLLQGVGFAGIVPVLITSIGDIYSGAEESAGQGFRVAVSGISQAVFPVIAGLLVAAAWYYPFFLYAVTFPIAAVIYLWFEEPSDIHRTATDGGPSRSLDRNRYLRSLASLVTQPRVLAIMVGRTTPVVVFVGFLTYNSVIVVNLLAGTPREAGFLVAVVSLVYAVAATQTGRITDAFDRRVHPLFIAHLVLGGGIFATVLTASLLVAGVGAVLIGLGFGTSLSMYRSLMTEVAPEALRGGLVSSGESLGRLAATLTPLAIGGALTVAGPLVGFESALRFTLITVGIVGGGVGVASAGVLAVGAPVSDPLEG
jgi:MFS family permease